MKQKKALMIAIAAVVAVAIIVIAIHLINDRSSSYRFQDKVESLFTDVAIRKVTYNDGEGVVTIVKDGDNWSNLINKSVTYDDAKVDEWIKVILDAQSMKYIKVDESDEQIGFEDHVTTIALYDEAGNQINMAIGNYNKVSDGSYVKVDGKNNIYVVAKETIDKIKEGPNKYAKCPSIEMDGELNDITFKKLAESLHFEKLNSGIWQLVDYYNIPCNVKEDKIEDITKTIQELAFKEYIGTAEDVDNYGLLYPKLTVEIDGAQSVNFGNNIGDSIYVSIGNEKEVYTMDKAVFEKLYDIKPFSVINNNCLSIDNNEVKQIKLTNPLGTFVFKVSPQTVSPSASTTPTVSASPSTDTSVTPMPSVATDALTNPLGTFVFKVSPQTVSPSASTTPTVSASPSTDTSVTPMPSVATDATPVPSMVAETSTATPAPSAATDAAAPTKLDKYTFNGVEITADAFEEWNTKITESIYLETELNNPAIEQDAAAPTKLDKYTFNGVEITADAFEEWNTKITESIYLETELNNPAIEQKEERKAEASIRYELKDSSIIEIELVPFDSTYYILRYNKTVNFAVNKDKVVSLFNELNELNKNQAKKQ